MPAPYTIFQCPRPDCRMRFPGTSETAGLPCPRCGTPVQIVGETYHSPKVEHQSPDMHSQEIHLLLDNLRSAFNVGSILRTADGAGCAHAYLCGISATPDNPKVAKTGLSAEFAVPWSYHPNGLDLAVSLIASGMRLWALEGGPRAEPVTAALPVPGGAPLVLVAGNELAGVDPAILELCERIVYLPMVGFKRSLNVAVAAGIALYLLRYGGNERKL